MISISPKFLVHENLSSGKKPKGLRNVSSMSTLQDVAELQLHSDFPQGDFMPRFGSHLF
jgi:hypothetical protein